jgi:hypothetical protein
LAKGRTAKPGGIAATAHGCIWPILLQKSFEVAAEQ